MRDGGWIFISHSHQDIHKVRLLRNRLEELGLEPLMFYLKCLSDEHEIEDLIKREIDERDWFIYADSPNSRASRWVQTERAYIEHTEGKKIFTIDLNDDLDAQLRRIEHIARQMKVYLSYSHKDRALCERLRRRLLDRDMMVLMDEDVIMPGMEWQDALIDAIDDAVRDGFVLLLLTERSVQSHFVRAEIEYALNSGGTIVPVYVGNVQLPRGLSLRLGNTVGVRIGEIPTEAELDEVVDVILRSVKL